MPTKIKAKRKTKKKLKLFKVIWSEVHAAYIEARSAAEAEEKFRNGDYEEDKSAGEITAGPDAYEREGN